MPTKISRTVKKLMVTIPKKKINHVLMELRRKHTQLLSFNFYNLLM